MQDPREQWRGQTGTIVFLARCLRQRRCLEVESVGHQLFHSNCSGRQIHESFHVVVAQPLEDLPDFNEGDVVGLETLDYHHLEQVGASPATQPI